MGAASSTTARTSAGSLRQRLRAHRSRLSLWAALVLLGVLTVYSLLLAMKRWEQPVPGVLADPFGRVTSYGWPGWSGYKKGLSFPDRIVAADFEPLPAPALLSRYPAAVLDAASERHVQGGQDGTELQLTVQRPGRAPTMMVPVKVQPLGWVPWLVLFGGYALLAWVWLFAAGLSHVVRPESPAVGAFVRWAVLNAVLLLTLFDFHTSRMLVPVFLLACALLPAAVLELGLRFPDDVRPLRRRPWLFWLVRSLGPALFLGFVAGWSQGANHLPALGVVLGVAVLGISALLALRAYVADGRRRTQLLLGLLLWMPGHLVLLGCLLFLPERSAGYAYLLLIPLTALGAVGMIYVMVRYDLWDSRVLLPRPVLRPLLTTVLGVIAGLLSSIVLIAIIDQMHERWIQVLVVFLAVTVALPLHRRIEDWLDERLFPADVFYRPTIEQLSLRFTDLASRAAVVEAVESTVRQWLPCERVRFQPLPPPVFDRADESGEFARSLPPSQAAMQGGSGSITASLISMAGSQSEPREWRVLRRAAREAGIEGLGSDQAASLCEGQMVHLNLTLGPNSLRRSWARLLIPARFRDQVVGLLALSSKRQSQLFTSEDENLLRTIGNQAALALACANASEQVEALRRAQQAAFREEKGAAVGTVAAEIAHEIRFPINFFRMLLESCARGAKEGKLPEAEDLDIGREEVERLERMAGNLRRLATNRTLNRGAAELAALVDHARMLLRDRLGSRNLEVELDPLLGVDCDRDAMTQILVNLIANALDACSFPGRVGVSYTLIEDGRLRLTVWDSGKGLEADIGKLFTPWFTTKKKGTGLGLPITKRLVRAHGWEIGASRRQDRTCFDVVIPKGEWHWRPPPADEGQFDSGPLK